MQEAIDEIMKSINTVRWRWHPASYPWLKSCPCQDGDGLLRILIVKIYEFSPPSTEFPSASSIAS